MQALLPQYEFIELLGQGGMAAVYKARQISLDRTVAIKVLPGDLVDDGDVNFVERFKQEARTMARLSHPAIVSVYDFGVASLDASGGGGALGPGRAFGPSSAAAADDPTRLAGDSQPYLETRRAEDSPPYLQLLFIVMEFVNGTDVAQMILAHSKLPPDYALGIAAHVCDALQYAHSHGVIHRDIKPANVLINRDGQVKVADFGLAKASDAGGAGLTKTNIAMGTPDFVAPEAMIAGIPLDGRADLYAVGVMLYNMLTGDIPRGVFTMPSLKLGTDPRFDAIIGKALQTDRENRYQTALEIRADLDRIVTVPLTQAGRPSSAASPKQAAAQTPGPSETAAKTRKAGPLLAIAATAVALIGLFVFFNGGEPESTGDTEASANTPAPAQVAAENPKPKPVISAPATASSASAAAKEAVVATVSKPAASENPKDLPIGVAKQSFDLPAREARELADTTPAVAGKSSAGKNASPSLPTAAMVNAPSSGNQLQTLPEAGPVAKRLAELEGQFAKAYDQQAGKTYQTAIGQLNASFVAALDRALASASKAGDLEQALAVRAEKERMVSGQGLPPADLETLPATLKAMRATYRQSEAKLAAERDKTAAPLYDFYDQALARYQAELTQEQKLDDAMRVKARRDEVAARKPKLEPGGATAAKATAQTAANANSATKSSAPAVDDSGSGRSSRWYEAARWVLSVGGFVDVVKGGQQVRIDQEDQIPPGRFEIRTVGILRNPKSANITNDDFARLSGLKELTGLEVRGVSIGDAALAFLPTTPEITRIAITATTQQLTDGIIAHLAPLQKLKNLEISTARDFTGAGFDKLASLPVLRLLSFTQASVSDDALRALSGAVELETLRLDNNNNVTDAGVESIAKLPKLRHLYMARCLGFGGTGFAKWPATSVLQTLDLNGASRLEAPALAAIARLKNLETLILDNYKSLTDETLSELAPLTKLKNLGFIRTAVAGTGFAALSGCTEMSTLYAQYETPLSGEGFATIARTFPKLKKLALGNGVTATSEEFGAVASLQSLTELELPSGKFDDSWFSTVGKLANLERLQASGSNITAKGLEMLKGVKSLRHLHLNSCQKVDDTAVPALKQLKMLQTLELRSTKMSESSLAELRKALPACRIPAPSPGGG